MPATVLCPVCCKDMQLETPISAGTTVRCSQCGSQFSAADLAPYLTASSDAAAASSVHQAWSYVPPAEIGRDPVHAASTSEAPATVYDSKLDAGQVVTGLVLPGYEIHGVLGRGGMGLVYKARQQQLNRWVAVKMILPGASVHEGTLARFRTEAEAVARLDHPNVVRIYEVGAREGVPFFALEYCAGGSLARRIDGTPQPPRAAAGIVEKLARGMHAAHERHIIHRDLKPANVLLTADGEPKITDFGLAKKLDDASLTHTGVVMGTPSYMSPEQAAGKTHAIGPAADIYALGAILYELLTGRAPFRGASVQETLLQVLQQEPVRPTQLQTRTPRDLETICLKCLDKDPLRRYASAADLAEDLRRWLHHEPIRARRAGPVERSWKWARRRPAQALVVGFLLMACAGGVISLLHYLQTLARDAHELQRLAGVIARGQRLGAERDWDSADGEFALAEAALDAQPSLQAAELRAELQCGRDLVWRGRQARQRRQDFERLHDESLVYFLQARRAPDVRAQASRAAAAALQLYDVHDGMSGLEQDRPLLSSDEWQELVSDCVKLLVVEADTEALEAAATEADPTGGRLARARALLDRARPLGEAVKLNVRLLERRRQCYEAAAAGQPAPAAVAPQGFTLGLEWFLTGLERYQAGQFDAARQACRAVLDRQPLHYWASHLHACCQWQERYWGGARQELTVCLERRRDLRWPLVLRGWAIAEIGLASNNPAELKAARKDYEDFLEEAADPILRCTALINRGVLSLYERRWEDAFADLNSAAAAQRGYQAHLNLASAHRLFAKAQTDTAVRRAHLQHALDAASEALARVPPGSPERAVVHEIRAWLHDLCGDPAAAQKDVEQALTFSEAPRRLDKHLLLGKLCHDQKKYARALECYAIVVAGKPAFAAAHYLRAMTLCELMRSDEAAQALDRYLELEPRPRADAYQLRGELHMRRREYAAAVEKFTLALRLGTRNEPGLLIERGWAYLGLDAAAAACADFDACLDKRPDARAWCGRGRARARLGQFAEALADAEKARHSGSLSDLPQEQLASLYAQVLAQLQTDAVRRAQAPADYAALYERRAAQRLRELLDALPPARRDAFWRDQLQRDPSLAPLRRSELFASLAAHYSLPNR